MWVLIWESKGSFENQPPAASWGVTLVLGFRSRPLLQCVCANISGSDRLWRHSHSFKTLCNKRWSFFVPETAINIGYACNVLTDAMDGVFVITGNTALEVRRELRCVWREREKGSLGRGKDFRAFGKAEVCTPLPPALPLSAGVPASFLQSRSCLSQKLGWSWH